MKKLLAVLATLAALSAFAAAQTPAPGTPPPTAAAVATAPATTATPPAASKANKPFVIPADLKADGPFSPKKCFKRCMKEIDERDKCTSMCGINDPA